MVMTTVRGWCLMVVAVLALLGCGEANQEEKAMTSTTQINSAEWQALTQKRVFFGHQSVGNNILDGIRDISATQPQVKFDIVEVKGPEEFIRPILGHTKIGQNMDPRSKLDDFVRIMESGVGQKVDIAFLKFCFVDIESSTDIMELFNLYKSVISNLKEKYPKVIFVHVTVPLTTVQTGWKVPIKWLLGKPIGGYADNIKRNEYNDLLKKEYSGKEPVFDLAGIESSSLDGKRSSFVSNEKTYYSLLPSYTYDGAHLNDQARKIVAEQLLVILANISK